MNVNSLNLKLRAKWTHARAWFQQCWKSCAYESSEVALRFDDHGMKEMMRVVS